MSWKIEVRADSTGTWAGNALRFATHAEAESYARDLWARWTAVRATRVIECDDEVTDRFIDGMTLKVPVGLRSVPMEKQA